MAIHPAVDQDQKIQVMYCRKIYLTIRLFRCTFQVLPEFRSRGRYRRLLQPHRGPDGRAVRRSVGQERPASRAPPASVQDLLRPPRQHCPIPTQLCRRTVLYRRHIRRADDCSKGKCPSGPTLNNSPGFFLSTL